MCNYYCQYFIQHKRKNTSVTRRTSLSSSAVWLRFCHTLAFQVSNVDLSVQPKAYSLLSHLGDCSSNPTLEDDGGLIWVLIPEKHSHLLWSGSLTSCNNRNQQTWFNILVLYIAKILILYIVKVGLIFERESLKNSTLDFFFVVDKIYPLCSSAEFYFLKL